LYGEGKKILEELELTISEEELPLIKVLRLILAPDEVNLSNI